MKAEEAKKISISSRPKAVTQLLELVLMEIESMAHRGAAYLRTSSLKNSPEAIRQPVLDELKKLGYDIASYGDGDHKVTWP